MENARMFTEEEMWEATISCNADYDRLFYYAVKTTGIYCRPSCKSKMPNRENVLFFFSAEDAEREGFRPCKRCCPDSKGTADSSSRLIKEAKDMLHSHFQEKVTLNQLAFSVGVSAYHLNRMFKEQTGRTPREYLENLRIRHARKLLQTSALTATEIGFLSGFQSLSSFYKAFWKHEHCSPVVFRKGHGQ